MRTLDEIADEVDRIRWAFSAKDSRHAEVIALGDEIRAHARKPKHFAANPQIPGNGLTIEDDQARAYPAGTKVFLYDNGGVPQVSVALVESPDYWIWSYPTEDQARAACKRHGWVIDEVRSVKP